MTVTHQTITIYKYSNPEVHGHTSYREALAFANSRLKVNPVGSVSVKIDRLDAARGDVWIETLGGIR